MSLFVQIIALLIYGQILMHIQAIPTIDIGNVFIGAPFLHPNGTLRAHLIFINFGATTRGGRD